MTSKISKLLIFGAVLALLNCKGKDPDPSINYVKAMEKGSFKGTIKGTRRDGTAFEEPFEYKINSEPEGFYKSGLTMHRLSIYRSEGIDSENGAFIRLAVENKGASNQSVKIIDFDIDFSKLISNNSIFLVNAYAYFAPGNTTLPISQANNTTYKMVNFGRNKEHFYDFAASKGYYIFKDTDGNTIYFGYAGPSEYKYEFYITPAGDKVTSSTTWNNVYYNTWSSSFGGPIFYISGGANLHEVVTVPADTQQISNFAYNATTGEVSFDYTVNIHQYRSDNTTGNPLEIKGSVKAVVYDNITYRKSFEGKNG